MPSTVDAAPPGIFGRRGVSVYSRDFETEGGRAYLLDLQGCAFFCRVWVDGQEVGGAPQLTGGYVPLLARLPPQERGGRRTLTVLADNRFNSTTAPLHTGGDFWHYGGLVRSVVLHSWPAGESSVRRAYVTPAWAGGEWSLEVEVVFDDDGGDEAGTKNNNSTRAVVEYSVGGGEGGAWTREEVAVSGGRARFGAAMPPGSKEWGLRAGHLHLLSVRTALGGGVTERFGLRRWGVAGSRLTLNGEAVKLVGWNHHTQWPCTAMSPTAAQLDSDLALLLQGGATLVRGAHYPQDQRWLDRLDEAGLAMWEEALGPGVKTYNLRDEAWMAHQLAQLAAMVDNSFNHASVAVWAFFNEGPSDEPAACPGYGACASFLKARDPSRLVTYASDKGDRDACLDHVPLASFNSYPGWYHSTGNLSSVAPFWTYTAGWLQRAHPGKAMLISETGAGAIYEWDNETDVLWSPKFQAEVLARDVDVAISTAAISGIALWHFFDFKGNDGAQYEGQCDYIKGSSPPTCAYIRVPQGAKGRPGGENHKGSLDFWRRPKPAFFVVAAKYNATLPNAPTRKAAGALSFSSSSPVLPAR